MKTVVLAIAALAIATGAAAQSGPGDNGPAQGKVNLPSDAANEPPGSSGGWPRKFDANGRMREKDYIEELERQMAQAESLVGRQLTEKDRARIREAVRNDLIVWRTQYDPRRKDYSAMRQRWLVDEGALSPEGWAKQRVEWLRAQHEWIRALHGG